MNTRLIAFGAIIGAFVLGILAYSVYNKGYDNGVAYVSAINEREHAEWVKKVEDAQTNFNKVQTQLTKDYTEKVRKLEDQVETLKKNPKIITKYITKEQNLSLPYGFVLYHNRLVRNESVALMIPTETDEAQSCDFTLYDLSDTIATNYVRCNECMTKLKILQDTVKNYIANQESIVEKGE